MAPHPESSGSLSASLISELLGSIARDERSGDLIVESGDTLRKVMFDRGFVVFASSNVNELRLGDILLRAGRITPTDLERVLEIVSEENCRIGDAVIRAGFMSAEDVESALATHVRAIATSVYGLREGTYRFDEHPCRVPENLRLGVSIYRVQLEGVRSIADAALIEDTLKPERRYIKTAARAPFSAEGVAFEPSEMRVCARARDVVSIDRMIEELGGERSAALRTVYGLLAAGMLELADAPSEQSVVAPEAATIPYLPDQDWEGVAVTTAETAPETTELPAQELLPESLPQTVHEEPEPIPHNGTSPSGGFDTDKEIARLFNEIKIRKMVYDTEGVVSMLGRVVSIAPENPKYVTMLAKAVASLPGKEREAEPHFRRALALDPDNAKLHYDAGCFYKKVGMPSRALAELKTALRIDPGLSEARTLVVELKGKKEKGLVTASLRKIFS